MKRLVFTLVLAAAAAVSVGTPAALADLVFDRSAAAPGQRVEASLVRNLEAQFEVYFMPVSLVDRVTLRSAPDDPRVVSLGELVANRAGVGRISFAVPRVSPGRYTTRLFCLTCGSFLPQYNPPIKAGQTVGVLRVTASGAKKGDGTPLLRAAAVGGGGALLVTAGMVALLWRRRPRDPV